MGGVVGFLLLGMFWRAARAELWDMWNCQSSSRSLWKKEVDFFSVGGVRGAGGDGEGRSSIM